MYRGSLCIYVHRLHSLIHYNISTEVEINLPRLIEGGEGEGREKRKGEREKERERSRERERGYSLIANLGRGEPSSK